MKKLLLPLFSICLITASCGDDDNAKSTNNMSISSCYMVKSNAVKQENFTSPSSPIGLYVLSEDGRPYEGNGLFSASLSSGSWSMSSPVYVSKAGKVYSYYPYLPTDTAPVLPVDAAAQVDLLYSKVPSAIAPGSASLSIRFYHALSRLTVSVEGEEVAKLSFTSPLTSKFNICSGAFTDKVQGVVTVSSGQMLVVPHTASTELKITLGSGKEYSYPVSGIEFRSGETCAFQFRLNDNREKLEVLSFSVEDWVEENNYNDYL